MAKCYRPEIYQSKTARKVETPRDERQKLYNKRWNRASTLFREHNPWCVQCGGLATGSYGATDHIVPHKGNIELFWDQSNWQTLCVKCHNRKSAGERDLVAYVTQDEKPHGKRFVVTGPPNCGKTTYVRTHKGPGAVVWDADDIVKVMCGADRHEWPPYMRVVISEMLDGFARAFQKTDCEELWVIVTDHMKAVRIAGQLRAELVTMGAA